MLGHSGFLQNTLCWAIAGSFKIPYVRVLWKGAGTVTNSNSSFAIYKESLLMVCRTSTLAPVCFYLSGWLAIKLCMKGFSYRHDLQSAVVMASGIAILSDGTSNNKHQYIIYTTKQCDKTVTTTFESTKKVSKTWSIGYQS